ncbi:40S ribosomal protein S3a [Aduncisulcus paluster]|uniref:Small ribosomal subunit protein eS1 n=1 Tax=Aduncisulcus paluster TaxID=2918883 RepID=A0ABQ5K088_9EUKA|nr:40S ribosomal protein S3a [Aduncisulcus paluster]
MALGKNKRYSGRKGKKKAQDPFLKKEWYDLTGPAHFESRRFGQTLVTRTTGTKIASDSLKGRHYEMNLADLSGNEERAYRKIRMRCEDVRGRECLCNFFGMDMTTDHLRSLFKKRQTTIECHVDVKTTDGYTLRVFGIAFTTKRPGQTKKTCYAQASQVKRLRKIMMNSIRHSCSTSDLKGLLPTFTNEAIPKEIERKTSGIFPLQNIFIRKVKVIKAPKFDMARLMDMHTKTVEVRQTAAKEVPK